ncbi:MAG TPA: hypothetical protein PK286_06830 [Devosia sp.]|nr:hypothetical protein [Devosia sp.]
MSRSTLYIIIAALLVVVIGAGIYFYQESQKPGLAVKVDGNGISVQGNG